MNITKLLLTAGVVGLSACAFAAIGQAKTFEIDNNTNYLMVTHTNVNTVNVPITIAPHSKVTMQYQHLDQAEYVRVGTLLNGPQGNVFFSLDNDGVHGYTATHFSDKWHNGLKTVKLAVCEGDFNKNCHF